jgi:hypothetical protein
MKKILIFRSIRAEEMGYVVQDVIDKFNLNCEIVILTRPEYVASMKAIPNISSVLTFKGNTFYITKASPEEIAELSQHKFDSVIIPTSGNLDSYDNIIQFSQHIFGKIPIFYYLYPKNFIQYQRSIFKKATTRLIKIISVALAIPGLFVFFLGVLYFWLIKPKKQH